jgi:diacylglycerol kinase family enzyme
MAHSKPQRVAVLVNLAAGAVERQGEPLLRHLLTAAFAEHGISARLEFVPRTELDAAAARALQQALDRELDALVVWGGDGSINTVANALAGSGVPLGILPLGTLNHFARDLRIPTTLDGAVQVIATQPPRSVDVGELDGVVFVNNSSVGIYPYLVVVRERERRRRRLSKWAAMALAAARVLRHLPLFRLRIRVEGAGEVVVRSPCVFVGNNEYRLELPALGTRARFDRGELCIYAARGERPPALVRLGLRCILGTLDQERDLGIFKGMSVEVGSRRHWLMVAIDGEVRTMRSPLHYRVRRGALRVIAPPPHVG